jgi:hypothetical protein
MTHNAIPQDFDHNARDVLVLESLKKFVQSLDYQSSEFILSLGATEKHANVASLKKYLEESLISFGQSKGIKRIFYAIVSNVKGNVALSPEEIEEYLAEIILENDYSYWQQYIKESPTPEDTKNAVLGLIDIVLAKKLQQIVSDRIDKNDFSNPHVLMNILSYFSEGRPIYILIVDSLTKIILEEDFFDTEERGRACRTLVNNYRIENTLISILNNRNLTNRQKNMICTELRAYKKVYRKLILIKYDQKKEKDTVSKKWFKVKDFDSIKYYHAPKIVNDFITCISQEDDEGSLKLGRTLVLSVDTEDILRLLYIAMHARPNVLKDQDLVYKIYKQIYSIMNDYRNICKMEKASERSLKSQFSDRSKESRLTEKAIISAVKRQKDMSPMLGARTEHPLLPETEQNLEESGMLHLYNIWPISKKSQKLFNIVCKLKDRIPEEKEYEIAHLLYREKLLAFLMRLERVGIKIAETELPLITNAVQMETHNYFRAGQFFGSTGFWQSLSEKPPSINCCAKPHAVGNCLDQPLRHIIFRIFLGTGELYESPFIVDSTPRFGSMDEGTDEDSILDSLFIRPGLFLLDIPQRIKKQWDETQEVQLEKLKKVISNKIWEAKRAR